MADATTTTAAAPRKKTSKARRAFLIGGGLVGGALAVGFTLASKRITNAQGFKPPALGGDVAFNAWLKLAPDNALIVQVPRQEMGQGIYTTLAEMAKQRRPHGQILRERGVVSAAELSGALAEQTTRKLAGLFSLGPEAVVARAEGRADGRPTVVSLRSSLDEPAYLLIERGAWSSDAVLGSVVASLPDFVELFATEAPAAGLELSIGRMTLLFSDLTGSTALYERVGDARAYAVVQEHFRVMEQAIADHEGAVIKTMGDAVMASFSSLSRAVAAAIQAVRETEARHGELGIGVKLGVHEGPCLAVRANDRLDFFGTTVNLTARLQGQAKAGELVMMKEMAEIPGVAELLEGAPRRVVMAKLKGIAEERELVGVDLRPGGGEG